MTPEDLAALHSASFSVPRPWSATEFSDLLRNPHVFVLSESGGFLLGRLIQDEAELLTLAVAPQMRRTGIGRRLVDRFLARAQTNGVARVFLEVAVENEAATRLYLAAGFSEAGLRRAYFQTPDGRGIDALVLCRDVI